MSSQRRRLTNGCFVLAAAVLVAGASWSQQGTAPAKKLTARTYPLNGYVPELDGQWQGIRVAADAKVYFASSTHSARNGAAFFQYDPAAKKLTMLCKDITIICGEDPTKTPPQGKIHSDVVEAKGWIYFATHLANYWEEAAQKYTGAHLVGYELATAKFKDFGVVRPNYSCYSGVGVDAEGKTAYFFAVPFSKKETTAGGGSHLYRINLATGEKTDLGMVRPGESASFYFLVDKRGDCWFTARYEPGTLFCARAATGKIERFEDALPKRSARREGRSEQSQNDRWWAWAQPLGDGERCVFALEGDDKLWLFDAGKANTLSAASAAIPAATSPAPAGAGKQADMKDAFTLVAQVGSVGLGAALAGDRVYFVQSVRGQRDQLRLASISLRPGAQVVDHGVLTDQDGRRPMRIPSLAADAQGYVYMVGDWFTLEGEKGTLRHKSGDVYEEQPRNEAFAVADVSQDLAAAGKQSENREASAR